MEIQYRQPDKITSGVTPEGRPYSIVSFWQPDWNASKRRVSTASSRALKTPDELWAVACSYFDYTQKSPMQRKEYIKTGPLAGTEYTIETPRPFSWSGLSVYASLLGVAANLHRYARNENDMYTEYAEIVGLINDVMFSQKFEGAAVGMYKENIISREIGLADKQQTVVTLDQPLFEV
jgi:hypothetical protein